MRVKASSLAPRAQAWIRNQKWGRVLQVFDQACNLIDSNGEILSLVKPELGNGPFALVIDRDSFSNFISRDSELSTKEECLIIGPFHVETKDAEIWQPRPRWDKLQRETTRLLHAKSSLKEILYAQAPADSLAYVSKPSTQTSVFGAKAHAETKAVMRELLEGIARQDERAIQSGAYSLAGLGSGLTPAGDDFLIGVMHALWAIHLPEMAKRLSGIIAEAAIPRTTSLSGAWLTAAAQGEAAEPWHELFDAILINDAAAMETATLRILSTGHSSGADALGGFLSTLQPEVER